jgi:hypothetical protein
MFKRLHLADTYRPHVTPLTTEATTIVADTGWTQSRPYQTLDFSEQLVLLSLVFFDTYDL